MGESKTKYEYKYNFYILALVIPSKKGVMILDQNQHVLNLFWHFNDERNNSSIGGSLLVVSF